MQKSEGMYSSTMFILASSASALPLNLLGLILGCATLYLLAGANSGAYFDWQMFPTIVSVASLEFVAIDSIFQYFCVTQKDPGNAQALGILVITLQDLFNGFAPSPTAYKSWIAWGVWISPSYYAMATCVEKALIKQANPHGDFWSAWFATSFGFRDKDSLKTMSSPSTILCFIPWIVIMKTLTICAMRKAKVAK